MLLGDIGGDRVGRETLALGEALELPESGRRAHHGRHGEVCRRRGEADLERGIALALEANALRVAQRGYNNLAILMGDAWPGA